MHPYQLPLKHLQHFTESTHGKSRSFPVNNNLYAQAIQVSVNTLIYDLFSKWRDKKNCVDVDFGKMNIHRGEVELGGAVICYFSFTLQSCCGHFIYNSQQDPHNLEPLSEK